MTKVIMNGCNGHMGHVISDLCEKDPEIEIVAGIDINTEQHYGYPVFANIGDCDVAADAIIDFSHVSCIDALMAYCVSRQIPVANMSLGVNTLMELLQTAAKVLAPAGFDMEIVEKHHNQKLDAPSGTALMLADAVASALPYDAEYVYDRHERREKRPAHEIGISAIRGGTIVGEHSVLFCGRDEIIEIKHTALSREVFAVGAVDAAAFMAERTQPGMYDMSDVIASHK